MIYAPALHIKAEKMQHWSGKQVYLLAPSLLALVYFYTLAPGLTWSHWGADGGDFLSATAQGQVPHPPGFPLYMVLARLLSLIPYKNLAYRLNFLSASMAVGTLFLTALTLRKYHISLWSRLTATLMLGLAPLFWSQALITEVYTTSAFFISLAAYLHCNSSSGDISLAASGAVWGLAVAVHPTALFAAAAYWMADKNNWQRVFPVFLTVLLFYGSQVVMHQKPQRWADFNSLKGWVEYVSGQLYWDYAFAVDFSHIVRRSITWLTLFSQQFTPIGGALMIIGVYDSLHRTSKRTVAFILAIILLAGYAIIYNSIDSFIYLVPFMPLCIPYLGVGMDWLIKKGIPGSLLLLLPVVLLVSHWRSLSLHHDYTAETWLMNTLHQIPAGSTLLTDQDAYTFALWYGQDVKALRQDVLVIDQRLLDFPPYKHYILAEIDDDELVLSRLSEIRNMCVVDDRGVSCP
jgi:hypothetical protein